MAVTLKELAELILDASLYWTGEDEERNPLLKKAKTIAGLALEELNQ